MADAASRVEVLSRQQNECLYSMDAHTYTCPCILAQYLNQDPIKWEYKMIATSWSDSDIAYKTCCSWA